MKKELILGLIQLPKVGSKTAFKILEKSNKQESNVKDLYHLLEDVRKSIPRLLEYSLDEVALAVDKALQIIDKAEKLDIKVLSFNDWNYPQNFRNLSSAPIILYVKGNINALNTSNSVAVIGTREPTDFGRKAGYKLTKYFVEQNFTIISGLALGCDTVGHRSCLDHGGTTVAVLASGLDKIYPKQNSKLAEEILAKGGALISEYPPGTSPRSNFFVERDRLQSGLSDGICIIETDRKGGTMHTFKFATEQNRIVGALSHPPQFRSIKSNGNRYIIEENKGHPLGSSEEIQNYIKLILQRNSTSENESSPGKTSDVSGSQLELF